MVRRFSRAAAGRAASASQSDALVIERAGAPPRPEALPKQKRLAKRAEFLRVYETGRKIFSRYSVLFFAANELSFSRIGITATKKVGKANVRNRLKRWTREVYRRERGPLDLDSRKLDIVVNVKPNAADATFGDFSEDLTRTLRKAVAENRA